MRDLIEQKVRMRNLSINDPVTQQAFLDKLVELMNSGELILGKYVDYFENKVKKIVGSDYAISCSSASSGLYLALRSLDLKPEDEVITTPLTWLVTGSAILQVGARPVFVDVDENYNLDPVEVEKAISKRTKAILVVHYYGRLAQIEKLSELANFHKIYLIEDAAQAFGVHRANRFAGTYGDLGIYSFSPMKVIGGMGDAGVVVTRHEELAKKISTLRHCGTINREICISPESKHIMDELHAAFLSVVIENYVDVIQRRRALAQYYRKVLPKQLILPDLGDKFEHCAYDFPVQLKDRDRLYEFLNLNGIEARIRHPLLVSDQIVHVKSKKLSMPKASTLIANTLCLPIHNNLTIEEVDFVGELCRKFFKCH